MKKLVIILLLSPLFSVAQKDLPRFENDTLFTTCGYPIYKGQILQLANGNSVAGYFNNIKFHVNQAKTNTYSLQNSTVLVKNLKNYKYIGPDNNNIRIIGTVSYPDGKKEEVDLMINFERAVESYNGLAAELTVPEAFKTKQTTFVPAEINKQPIPVDSKNQSLPVDLKKQMVADEIKKLYDLYKAGALTKEEFEAQKKKLLSY